MRVKDLKGIIDDYVGVLISVEYEKDPLLDQTIFDGHFMDILEEDVLELELKDKPIKCFGDGRIFFYVEVPEEKFKYFKNKYKGIYD